MARYSLPPYTTANDQIYGDPRRPWMELQQQQNPMQGDDFASFDDPPVTGGASSPPPGGIYPETGGTHAPRPVNPNWQAPTAAGGANASRNAPRLTRNGNQWTLSEHGNTRPLQDSEAGNAQSYVDDYWSKFPTGFQPGVGPQSNAAYDAQRFTSPGRGSIPTGAGSGVANQGSFTGFNFGREHNRNASAKDSFAHWGGQAAGGDQWRTKDGAEQWFRENVMPGLQSDGFEVLDVQGDKAFVRTVENPEGTWIDFVQGADGDNPMLAWQDQSYGGDASAAGGGGGATLPPLTGLDGLLGTLGGDGSGETLLEQIQRELQAIQQGAPSPMSRDALLAQLEGR